MASPALSVVKGPGFNKVSAVAYAGDIVFTATSDEFAISYANIEGEGKTTYNALNTPEQIFFYIEDHLGSTRFVIGNDGLVKESLDCKP